MFLRVKNQIQELLQTMLEMVEILPKLTDCKQVVADCNAAVAYLISMLHEDSGDYDDIIKFLHIMEGKLDTMLNEIQIDHIENIKQDTKVLSKLIKKLNQKIAIGIDPQFKIVFFPYKASMWNSLESIYIAAAKDKNCVATVVPIPYYDITNGSGKLVYEGGQFPDDIPIINYTNYHMEQECPDVIFVHNIYDDNNLLTRVHERYYTANLKKHTNLLVYVPYFIPSHRKLQAGQLNYVYGLPGVKNVSKIVLINNEYKKAALREGIPKEKLLVLGSPKIDWVLNIANKETVIPDLWKKNMKGKTVFLLNTGCMFFAQCCMDNWKLINRLIAFAKSNCDKTFFIWRPHPLTLQSLKKFTPSIYQNIEELYEELRTGSMSQYCALDELPDYRPAFQVADTLISSESSLLREFLVTNKRIVYMDASLPPDSLLDSEILYFFWADPESKRYDTWEELFPKFLQGYDPKKEIRKGIAEKIFENVDGTCGEKVYKHIKEMIY